MKRIVLAALAAVAVLVLAGAAVAVKPPADPVKPAGKVVALSFLRGEHLAVAHRVVAPIQARTEALRALLRGPTALERAAGLTTAIPTGTKLLRQALEGSVVYVDLSKRFESGGGSASMQARVAQVVRTATQFAGVASVRIAIAGKLVKSIGGEGLDVSRPLTRAWTTDFLPNVAIESTAPGDAAVSPLTVSGTAVGPFRLVLANGDGQIAAERSVVLPRGIRSPFAVTMTFAPGLRRATLTATQHIVSGVSTGTTIPLGA